MDEQLIDKGRNLWLDDPGHRVVLQTQLRVSVPADTSGKGQPPFPQL